MKRLPVLSLVFLMLTGCTAKNDALEQAMQLRQNLLNGNGCNFSAQITADYKEEVYQFELDCKTDRQGNLTFTVTQPESIHGITGTVDDEGGKLTFDDAVLAFPMMADGQVTPVSAPWLMIRTLRSGYITAAGLDGEDFFVTVNDSYEEQALKLDFWLNKELQPKRCEILWQGRRILSIDVENFEIL